MSRPLPSIKSERLLLRLLSPDDLTQAIDYYASNREHLAPSGPRWPDNFLTEEFWIKQIERNLREYQHDFSARMFLFEDRNPVPVGHVSFSSILRSAAQFCYLGYGLAKSREGRGYMTEILPKAIEFAFNDLSIHRIMANYMPTNERSGRLLRRLGFSVEGYARDYLCLNGKWEDHIMCALINPNWQGKISS